MTKLSKKPRVSKISRTHVVEMGLGIALLVVVVVICVTAIVPVLDPL